ncbi:TPA_asm: RNA-directed RNA polymerase [ssRNA phage Gerhypos.3_21]|uniref:RNA-directed RNA polymerase n=2 Tax=Leviviricetes TaxID=2842243 RepID=A0A8S5L343_9VIRU|nr:RNA-directed RNA polymerase [ssRNA phage Gerhypos.3_21]QDH88233.1 MAG: RNA-dependent RNA polymerase [Leviviridae sp.]DAD52206.1 TPA_asm: RNA-directed RNA polymerase [ssRNA phage Gerhypos.3_21]
MNSLTTLLLRVLEESGTLCGIDTSQDQKTILARVESEGLSFLTITLPTYTKDLQRALDQGMVDSSLFAPFKRKKGEALPVFMGGFLSRAFDLQSGRILSSVDSSEAIDSIRAAFQVTGLLSKVGLDCTPKRVTAALDRYIENDTFVQTHEGTLTAEMLREFRTMSHWLFGRVFARVLRDVDQLNLKPVHGPGVVADRVSNNRRWDPVHAWPDELEYVFPRWRYVYSSGCIYQDEILSGKVVPGTVRPVRVITVPKTLKTPRIIAVEPTALQYAQQGLMRSFHDAIDRDPIGRVMSWTSQEPNQLLAKKGSLPYGESATLDLSDASDLVSNLLVKTLFADFPLLGEAVQAVRNPQADVNGQVIKLAKYASMGSAMCFPIESIVFTTLVFMGLKQAYPTIRPGNLLAKFLGKVRVYGDDIVVPVRATRAVFDVLTAFGLKVNRSKSFWTGMFRESCGKEYFHGADVTIARCRKVLPSVQLHRSKQVDEVVSTVELRNNLFLRGYTETAAWLDTTLEVILEGCFPYVESTSPALGRIRPEGHQTDKMDPDLQRPLVKAFVIQAVPPADKLEGYGALMKTLSFSTGLPNLDAQHLDRAGRPSSLRIKKRWTSPV